MNAMRFLNADLDIRAPFDLEPLSAWLEREGLTLLHVAPAGDRGWFARFEPAKTPIDPNHSIMAILSVLDRLDGEMLTAWRQCQEREINLGFDTGSELAAFTQSISAEIVARLASFGCSLGVTLYPIDP